MIKSSARKYKDYVINLRKELHENPGLSWEEYGASEIIKRELTAMGLSYREMAKTGVVVDIKGNYEGGCVLLRADMDALPVTECTNVSYKSKNEGKMHACGHDGHTAQLLGAVKVLNKNRDLIHGTVRCVFQPAEEIGQGAKKMIEEGVLEGVDGAFAIHLWSGIPVGKISAEAGPRMASADNFLIKIIGKGGHGSLPQQCVDPVVTASAFVMNLQPIVSRETNPNESIVITVGKIHTGTTANVIPNEAVIEGTARCFNPELRKEIPHMIERVLKGTVEIYRANYEMDYKFYPAPVINNTACTETAVKSAVKLYGKECLFSLEKMTTAEDFSAFSEKVPSVLAFVGVRNEEKECVYPHHHPKFNMDEDGFETGTALYAQYAVDFLNSLEK